MVEEHALEIRQLSKKIKKQNIINNVSFEVKRGEVVGLIGPNGAGKTSLLKMILGISGTSKGSLFINGKEIGRDFEEAINNVSAVLENPRFYKFTTGYKNIQLHNHKGSNENEIKSIIKLVGLEESINKKVKLYSLGMNQRLAIAIALLNKPVLLVLDEPTNGLDVMGVQELKRIIKDCSSQQNMGVLITSHSISELETICDRVVIINKGEIQSVEDVNSITKNISQFVFQFNPDTNLNIIDEIFEQNSCKVLEMNNFDFVVEVKQDLLPLLIKEFSNSDVSIQGLIPVRETLENRFIKVIRG